MHLFYTLGIEIGLLSLLAFTATIASNQNTANFQKLICTVYDKTLLKNVSCSAKPVSRQETIVRGSVFAVRPLNSIMVHGKLYKKLNVVYKPFLVDVKEELCDALSKKGNAPYTKIFLGMVGPYTSLNHTCPYEGWVMANNVKISLSSLKLLAPVGEYRLDMMGTLNKSPTTSITVQAYVTVGEKISAPPPGK